MTINKFFVFFGVLSEALLCRNYVLRSREGCSPRQCECYHPLKLLGEPGMKWRKERKAAIVHLTIFIFIPVVSMLTMRGFPVLLAL